LLNKNARNMKKIGFLAFAGLVLASITVAFLLLWSVLNLPKLDNMQDYRPALGTTVLSKDGRILGEFFDTERRYIKSMDEIPEWVANAFIAAEDGSFYEHPGIDYSGIMRAFWANLKAGRVVQGGSTITQQVAKSLLLTSERSYTRKMREVLLAYKIEKNFSKRQIISLYLNQIYFGQRAYGVEAASRGYFHKSVKEITVAEAALLAGLVQAPSKYSPSKNPMRAKERQLYVLRRMQETGKISEEEYKKAIVEPIAIYPEDNENLSVAPYYLEHVRQVLMEKYGADLVYRGGLVVETAADYDLSIAAMKAVKANLEELDKRQGYRGPLAHVSTPEAVIEELKKNRGEVLFKKFGHQILPAEVDEKMTESKWVDYTLAQLAKKDSSLVDERKLLLPMVNYRAVVTKIDPDGKAANLLIGSIKARLTVNGMRWAKRIKPPEISNWAQISRVSESLKNGDVISVSVNFPLPDKAEEAVQVSLEQEPLVQSALLSMEAATGHVVAMVGGYSFAASEYNRAMQGERQPGSSFKPTLYAAALDKGFTPSSIIVDSPLIFENQGSSSLKWIPENNSEKFYGDTTLRTAVINSRNVPAVKLLQEIGISFYVNYLKSLGLQNEFSPDLSLALGSTTISLLELTKLYALFPRLGMRIEPVFILKLMDRDGKVLEQYSFKEFQRELSAKWLQLREAARAKMLPSSSEATSTETSTDTEAAAEAEPVETKNPDMPPVFDDPLRAIDEKTTFVMGNLLQEVVQYGTGTGAKVLKRKVGGKTGTTNEFVDAWFMGFSPELVTGVWTGFDNPRSLGKGEVGSRAALPAWIDFMSLALEKYKLDDYVVPKGIVFVRVDPKTGALAGTGNNAGVKEAFVEGTEPTLERQNQQTPDSSDFFREDL
jgi:penicillin-binding protein 1A